MAAFRVTQDLGDPLIDEGHQMSTFSSTPDTGTRTGPLISDVMTADVVVAFPDTRVGDLAELVVALRLTAVPVTDLYDRVVGIVSASDLPLADVIAASRRQFMLRRRSSRAGTAGDLMTSPVVTVHPAASLMLAARTMVTNRVKQLPVVDDDDKLCGIVTSRDLLTAHARTDEEIEHEVVDDVLRRYLPSVAATIDVDVTDAVVTLTGHVPAAGMLPLAIHLAHRVPGVVDVVDRTSHT